jgi:hypothetical protein
MESHKDKQNRYFPEFLFDKDYENRKELIIELFINILYSFYFFILSLYKYIYEKTRKYYNY